MKIASVAPMSYTPGKLQYHQFIRGGIGADYHQEPKFYQYSDGTVMMYWSAYDYNECSGNLVKLYSISKDNGQTWSDPQVFIADYTGGVPYFLDIIRLKGTENALMFHTRTRHEIQVDEKRKVTVKGSNYFNSSTRIFLSRSNDGGKTFDYGNEIPYKMISGDKHLPNVGFYGSINCTLQLESGRIVVVFSFMDPERIELDKPDGPFQHYTGVCLISDDNGKTWRRSDEIIADTQRGVMELQVVETRPDQLLAFFRTKGGYIYQSKSNDGGKTWSKSVPSPLPAPESMSRMIKLQSGNLLVVWNNVSSESQHPRHPLAAAVSKDNGQTWSEPKVIADETGTNQLSNHGLIQLTEGRILLGISHYRNVQPMTSDMDMAIFDEKWLLK